MNDGDNEGVPLPEPTGEDAAALPTTPAGSAPSTVDTAKTIDLLFGRVWCPRHGEPFRAKWPLGAPVFAIMAVADLLEHSASFQAEIRRAEDEQRLTFPRAVEAALDQKPACCRFNKNALLALYLKAGVEGRKEPVFTRGSCFNCKRGAVGGPYRIQSGSVVVPIPHVCLRCVVFHMKPVT